MGWSLGFYIRRCRQGHKLVCRQCRFAGNRKAALFLHLHAENPKSAALQIPDEPIPIDPEEAAAVLENNGVFSKFFSSYEYRPEQLGNAEGGVPMHCPLDNT